MGSYGRGSPLYACRLCGIPIRGQSADLCWECAELVVLMQRQAARERTEMVDA